MYPEINQRDSAPDAYRVKVHGIVPLSPVPTFDLQTAPTADPSDSDTRFVRAQQWSSECISPVD